MVALDELLEMANLSQECIRPLSLLVKSLAVALVDGGSLPQRLAPCKLQPKIEITSNVQPYK